MAVHFTYKQSTGELISCDGMSYGFGFSGNGAGLNNPAAQDQHGVGPLPQGFYRLKQWIQSHPTMGLCVIELEPIDEAGNPRTEGMFGRGGFYFHGTVSLDRAGLAAFLKSSDGCICFRDCSARSQIWDSNDRELQVVA